MALVPCPECGKNVSTMAASCPHCGCPSASADKTNALATIPAQAISIPMRDDRNSRVREELEYFKSRFARTMVMLDGPASESGIWRHLLDEAEDLISEVCGREFHRSLLDAANNLTKLHEFSENVSPNMERRAQRRQERGRKPLGRHGGQYEQQYESELASLKRRVEAIEYRH